MATSTGTRVAVGDGVVVAVKTGVTVLVGGGVCGTAVGVCCGELVLVGAWATAATEGRDVGVSGAAVGMLIVITSFGWKMP